MIDYLDEALQYKLDENDVEDFQEYQKFFRLYCEDDIDSEPKELDFENNMIFERDIDIENSTEEEDN